MIIQEWVGDPSGCTLTLQLKLSCPGKRGGKMQDLEEKIEEI